MLQAVLQWLRQPRHLVIAVALAALLSLRFLHTLWLYDVPLGYDPGLYRYLFLQYAKAWPPFVLPALSQWALEHPPGLFMFTTPLLRLGLPVDWLLGWVWNVFAIALACTLAWATAKRRQSVQLGCLVLLMTCLSLAYFDGFAAMYWKAFAGLLFCVLAFYFLERKVWWAAALWVLLCIGTHHQTAVILALSAGSWWLCEGWRQRHQPTRWLGLSAAGGVVVLLGFLWYWRIDSDFVVRQLQRIVTVDAPAYGGAFPPVSYYLQVGGILFGFGVIGLGVRVRQAPGTIWQWAVLWSAVFVFFKLHFYRRFYLHLDFFLLPFAAEGVLWLWHRYKRRAYHGFLVILLGSQAMLTVTSMEHATPSITRADLDAITALREVAPTEALVLVPENLTALWVLGWLPEHDVAAPGLFGFDWRYRNWWVFLYGEHKRRRKLLRELGRPVQVVVLPPFFAHYKEYAAAFINDACFHPVGEAPLLAVDCRPKRNRPPKSTVP